MKNIKFMQLLLIALVVYDCTILASNRPRTHNEIEEDQEYDAYVQRKLEKDPDFFYNMQKEDEDEERRAVENYNIATVLDNAEKIKKYQEDQAVMKTIQEDDEAQERKIDAIIAAQQEEDDRKYEDAQKALSQQNNNNVKIQALRTKGTSSKGGNPSGGGVGGSTGTKPFGSTSCLSESQKCSQTIQTACCAGYKCLQGICAHLGGGGVV